MKAALSILLLFLGIAHAQTGKKETQQRLVFQDFQSALDQLNQRPRLTSNNGTEADINELLAKISGHVKFLAQLVATAKPVPKEYFAGVALDSQLLKELSQLSSFYAERGRLYEKLKELESDLAIKVSGPRGGGEVARVVEVLVRAKKGDEEVSAYEVWYVTRGWRDTPSAFRRFDRLTNPAKPPSMKFSPGNYFIWLNKEKLATQPQSVSLGLDRETKREIELVVP
jgi:hypothetical protein